MSLKLSKIDENHWILDFSLLSRKSSDTLYLSCSENCFSEGNLKLSGSNSKKTISINLGPGKFTYWILKDQYATVSDTGKKVKRKKSIFLPLEGVQNSFNGRNFSYNSSRLSQVVVLHGDSSAFNIILGDGLTLIRKDRNVPYGPFLADVFFLGGAGEYTLSTPTRDEKFFLQDKVHSRESGSGIIYQIFPDRFYRDGPALNTLTDFGKRPKRDSFYGGNLRGIIDKLDYLKSLNIEYLYLNPLYRSHSNHRYDVDDYFEVDPLLGTKEDLKELVRLCHERGIKVILDMVFNHTSVYFEPFADIIRNGDQSSYINWYIFHGRSFKPFDSNYNARRGGRKPPYETFMGVGHMPKLNHSSREVASFLGSVVDYHLKEFDIDGFRYDVGHSIPQELIAGLKHRAAESKPGIIHIGEAWCLSRSLVDEDYYDSLTNYHIRKSITDYVKGKDSVRDLYSHYIEEVVAYGNRMDQMMNILDSHDTPRILTSLGYDREKLKLSYLILMLMNGRPTIYYGDEVSLPGNGDPDCRRTFPWNEIGSDVNEYFIKLGSLRARIPEFSEGLFFVMEYNDIDILVKMGNKQSLILAVSGVNGSDVISDILPDTAENILSGNNFDLYTLSTIDLLKLETSLAVSGHK